MTQSKRTEPIETSQHTFITHEENYKFNAPHDFLVHAKDGSIISHIRFQQGPIKEAGVNGVTNEDLLQMVKLRLEGFQNSEFACQYNGEALEYINAAIRELEKRTQKRLERGVEGTHVV